MVDKSEYERLFNEIFGTSIKWSKLSKEELVQLATVLANPEALIRKLGGIPKTSGESKLIDALKATLESINYEGPIITTLKKILGIPAETKKKEQPQQAQEAQKQS